MRERLDRAVWIGLGIAGLGGATLLVNAWIEYLTTPDTSLVDAYWIGREPWTSIGAWLVSGGASLALLAAAVAVAIRGDWLRRLLMVGVLALPAWWWAVALGAVPFPRYTAPGPASLAFSMPETAVLTLVLPALAAVALTFLPHRPDLRPHMRPVHPDGAPPRTDEPDEFEQ